MLHVIVPSWRGVLEPVMHFSGVRYTEAMTTRKAFLTIRGSRLLRDAAALDVDLVRPVRLFGQVAGQGQSRRDALALARNRCRRSIWV